MGTTPSKSKTGYLKEINKTTIFKQEQPQTWCCCCKNQVSYRIPALVYLNDDQTFLAFAEKRKTLSDTDAEVLVMRRGTLTHAKTQEVEWVSGHHLLSSACLPNHRSMNPCPVYERESKTLFLFFICVPTRVSEYEQIRTNKSQGRLCYVTSKDAGKTWSHTVDLTADVIGEQMKEWAPFAVGPGHGVQMKSGRLIIPAYAYRYTGKPDCTSCCCLSFCCFTPFALAFYSDDQGITWKVGNQMDVESCECQMAAIIDEEVYCNARTRLGYRTEALSYNSGEDFGKVLSPNKLIAGPSLADAGPGARYGVGPPSVRLRSRYGGGVGFRSSRGAGPGATAPVAPPKGRPWLIETEKGCQGSVLSFLEQSSPPKTWLLYSHPSSPKNRVDLGLYLNKTPLDPSGWPGEPLLILHHGPSAYSDLVEYEPGRFACLMECGTEHENEEIAFLQFELPEKKL